MSSARLQILIVGNQDSYLIGNPNITFYKSVYRKHTNFSINCLQQDIHGTPDFGSTYTCNISKSGDLLCGIYLDCKLPAINFIPSETGLYGEWVDGIGYAMIDTVEVNIDDKTMDKHTGEWLYLRDKLNTNNKNHNVHNSSFDYGHIVSNDNKYQTRHNQILLDGNINALTGIANVHNEHRKNLEVVESKSYLGDRCITPLQFWFCNNYGLSLPMISIPDTQVSIKIKHREIEQLLTSNFPTSDIKKALIEDDQNLDKSYNSFKIWAEYIYLDADERRKFVETSHKYLIETINYENEILLQKAIKADSTEYEQYEQKLNLDFLNCVVKYLVWVPHMKEYIKPTHNFVNKKHTDKRLTNKEAKKGYSNNWFNFSTYNRETSSDNAVNTNERYLFKTAQIIINNEHRTDKLPVEFMCNILPKRHFNIVPYSNYIYSYSFALNPLDHQPTGFCNFKSVDQISLLLDDIKLYTEDGAVDGSYINIYGCSYNILNINSGNIYLEYY